MSWFGFHLALHPQFLNFSRRLWLIQHKDKFNITEKFSHYLKIQTFRPEDCSESSGAIGLRMKPSGSIEMSVNIKTVQKEQLKNSAKPHEKGKSRYIITYL
jgi:hypothetical protein